MAGALRKIFHLHLVQETRAVTVDLPSGTDAQQLVAAARKLADVMVAEGERLTGEAGGKISCKMGCAACCRQLVRISIAEALALADLVARMPPERQAIVRGRFVAAMAQLRDAGMVLPVSQGDRPRLALPQEDMSDQQWEEFVRHYHRLQIACPFLENECCSIYEDRPLICGEYMVTTPASMCGEFDVDHMKTVRLPVDISKRFLNMQALSDREGSGKTALIFALEFVEAVRDETDFTDMETLMNLLQMFCVAD